METTLMLILTCSIALMGIVVLLLTIEFCNSKKEIHRRLIQLELDYEHLRKQFIEARGKLSESMLMLIGELCKVYEQLDELNARKEAKAKAKSDMVDKFNDIVKTIADKYPNAEINVIDLDKFKSDKFDDIYTQPLKPKAKTKTVEIKDAHNTDKNETPAQKDANAKRIWFAEYREKLGMSIREAAEKLGVSLTTAKRYEKWRVSHKE